MNKLFTSIQVKKNKTNNFDLSHEKKLSCNMGDLIPILCEEVIPGDRFRVNTELLLRMAPMLAPIMHRVNVYTHYFFVPDRIIFDGWENFITGGKDGKDTTVFPQLEVGDTYKEHFYKGSLADYLGVPPLIEGGGTPSQELMISALPFRAYQMIYNEYYRDQNLTNEIDFGMGSTIVANDYAKLCTLRKRCWEKDYFTSALLTPQRGDEVVLPIDTAVEYTPISRVYDSNGGTPSSEADLKTDNAGQLLEGSTTARIENIDSLTNDITINAMRRAVKLQQWLERGARSGARYKEKLWAFFNVNSSDQRLQRPEYLGGGKSPVIISEVLQTSETGTSPQGNMAGHGVSVGNTHQFSKYFEEHGYVIGIMSVLPRTSYMNGIPKTFLKKDKFDFFWNDFAQLGEQEIFNCELKPDYYGMYPMDGVFGYQSRYSEYKFGQSSCHGDFRDTLSYWHMARIFGEAPALNEQFVQADPTHRIFAVTDPTVHKLYIQLYNDVRAIRQMPLFGTPSL
jgi:hypothetical protein